MYEKTTKLLVDDILDDLREDSNRVLDRIFENIDYFSVVFKQNDNNFDEYSDVYAIKLNQLKSYLRKFGLNYKYLEKSIIQFITQFEDKIYRNSKQNNDLNSDNPKTELSTPKRKPSVEELAKTCTKSANSAKTLAKNTPIFECIECKERFESALNLELHANRDHRNVESFVCHECKRVFDSKDVFLRHLSSKHKNPVFGCDLCDYKTYIEHNLAGHMVRHSNERPFRCNIDGCDQSFKTKVVLKTHQKSLKHSAKQYVCDWIDCNRRFRNKIGLKTHKLSHKSDKPFSYYKKKKQINELISSAISMNCRNSLFGIPVQKSSVNIKPKRGRKPKNNTIDSNTTESLSQTDNNLNFSLITELLQQNRNKSRKSGKTVAIECQPDISASNDIEVIENSNLFGFVCNECEDSFETELDLELHSSNVHKSGGTLNLIQLSDYSTFFCRQTDCNSIFNNKSELKKHLLEKHFECKQCDQILNTKESLLLHVTTVHKPKRTYRKYSFVCHVCSDTFYSNDKLINHLSQKHRIASFECDLCDFKSLYKHSLALHKTRHLSNRPIAPTPKPTDKFFKCEAMGCDQLFDSSKDLKLHISLNHSIDSRSSKQFVCDYPECGREFSFEKIFLEHKAKHPSTQPSARDSALQQSVNRMIESNSTRNLSQRLSKIVEKKSDTIADKSLVKRLENSGENSPDLVIIDEENSEENVNIIESETNSSKTVVRETNDLLIRENTSKLVQTEPGVMPTCDECLEGFETEFELDSHLTKVHKMNSRRSRPKSEPKVVPNVNQSSIVAQNVNQSQTIELTIMCDKCEQTFANVDQLQEHQICFQTDDTFGLKCRECHQMFDSKHVFDLHNSTVHNKQNVMTFDCILCKFNAENEESLRYHKLIVHQISDQSINPLIFSTTFPTLPVLNNSLINTNINTNSDNSVEKTVFLANSSANVFKKEDNIQKHIENVNQFQHNSTKVVENDAKTSPTITTLPKDLLINTTINTNTNQTNGLDLNSSIDNKRKSEESVDLEIKSEKKRRVSTITIAEDLNPVKVIANSGINNQNTDNLSLNSIPKQSPNKLIVCEDNKNVSIGSSAPKAKQFLCNKCDKTFDSIVSYISHTKTHFNAKEIALKCTECAFITKDLLSLIGHQKTHKKPIK